ncbi:MAG TPA: RNA methyltransferase [Lacipirellulaceae bacterium]|nr:RNA methyltransferase [Lacipirellulaceae bacterium]
MSDPSRITSRQNAQVKEVVRLRNARDRGRAGKFIIDGAREISRAVEAGISLVQAFVCAELARSAEARAAIGQVTATTAEILHVSPEVADKLAFGDRNDGVIVVAATPQRSLNDLHLSDKPIIAVLEGIEKPGNVGAILRSADATGIDALIIADGRTDLFNPNTIRASLGTVFRPNVCEATTAASIAWLRDKKLPILAARPDASKLYTEIDLRRGVAIVLGSEATGLSDAWRAIDITPMKLPMHGIADSLNVSTTAAVLFYEALRQRT